MKKNTNIKTISTSADLSREVGYMVKQARQFRGLSQRQLAEKCGTQQPSIARIESGSVVPTLSFLSKISDNLGMKLAVVVSPLNQKYASVV